MAPVNMVEIECWVVGEYADDYVISQTPEEDRDEDDTVRLPKEGCHLEYVMAVSGKHVFSIPEHIAHDLELEIVAFTGEEEEDEL